MCIDPWMERPHESHATALIPRKSDRHSPKFELDGRQTKCMILEILNQNKHTTAIHGQFPRSPGLGRCAEPYVNRPARKRGIFDAQINTDRVL